ncbi:MAG: hypothetical protein WC291_00085 [Thermodesulfovibrionales bacterium]|jgi:hypothetical protein
MGKIVLLLSAFVFLLGTLSFGECVMIAGLTDDEALRLGERMYREGILSSGEPMQAVVGGGVTVDGKMFTCGSCHLRSGLGSLEGSLFSPRITGPRLFSPVETGVESVQPFGEALLKGLKTGHPRPAYTDERLAMALREGIDPTGRELNLAMPMYPLSDRDMEILSYYLRNLSAELSPGATEQTLRFATVVSDGVSPGEKASLVKTLQGYFDLINAPPGPKKWKGSFLDPESNRLYGGKVTLSLWELKGARETWKGQLEEYYKKEPVFAIVSGRVRGDWEPIHRFSEEQRIPSLFPLTDLPVIAEKDWYTLYSSRGLYQEGVTVARYLNRAVKTGGTPVVQVYRDREKGALLDRGLRESWDGPTELLKTVVLAKEEKLSETFWKKLARQYKGGVFVLWLDEQDIPSMKILGEIPERPFCVFVSSTLMNMKLSSLPDTIRGFTYATYPRKLPKEYGQSKDVMTAWLKTKGIPVGEADLQMQVLSSVRIVAGAIRSMGPYLYRDYLLDTLDSLRDQVHTAISYPRLSFGQGQRYASKGCYIVRITEGADPEVVRLSDWIIALPGQDNPYKKAIAAKVSGLLRDMIFKKGQLQKQQLPAQQHLSLLSSGRGLRPSLLSFPDLTTNSPSR